MILASNILKDALDFIQNAFLRIFFGLIKLIFQLIDSFVNIVFTLAGVYNIDGTDSNILATFFTSNGTGAAGNQISRIYMYICLGCVVLMIFLAVVAIIKQDFFSEDGESKSSHALIFKRMALGILYFIAIPPIFIFSVSVVSDLVRLLMNIDSFSELTSISQSIFELSLTEPEWMKLSSNGVELDPIPHWSVITADDLVSLTQTYNFNLIIFLAVIGMALYSMFMLAFALVKRIINIVIAYVVGPIAISQSVVDGGKKMKLWKDNVISEFVSIFGTVISLAVFAIFINVVIKDLNLFNVSSSSSNLVKNAASLGNMIVKAIFIMVGFSIVQGGSDFIKNAVGSNLTIDDGSNTLRSVQSAVSAATKPFTLAGQGVRAAAKVVGNTGLFLARSVNPDVWRERAENVRRPTLDAFRSEEQRQEAENARQERRRLNREMVAESDPIRRDELRRLANPREMREYVSNGGAGATDIENRLQAHQENVRNTLNAAQEVLRTAGFTTGDRSVNIDAASRTRLQTQETRDQEISELRRQVRENADVRVADINANITHLTAQLQEVVNRGGDDSRADELRNQISQSETEIRNIERHVTEFNRRMDTYSSESRNVETITNSQNIINETSNHINNNSSPESIRAANKINEELNRIRNIDNHNNDEHNGH